MKINRQELVKALEIVRPGLANKEMIEQSTSFAFIGDRVVTYNDEISVSCPVENLDITGAIKAAELYALLSKLTEEEIEIETTDTEILIKGEKAKAGFSLQKEIHLPLIDVEKVSDWKDIPDNLLEVMGFCLFSCSNDMSRPILTCIHLKNTEEGAIVESCDNYRCTRYKLDSSIPLDDVLIPHRNVEKLIKYEAQSVAENKGWLYFRMKDGTIFSCRVLEGDYPDLSPILQMEGKKILFPKKISSVLEKAAIFTKEEFLTDQSVTVSLENKKMSIQTKGESGWFEGKINIRYSDDPITFAINPTFLKEICEKIQTSCFTDGKIKFIGENWEHVIALKKRKGE